jgi:hypothetical protein
MTPNIALHNFAIEHICFTKKNMTKNTSYLITMSFNIFSFLVYGARVDEIVVK